MEAHCAGGALVFSNEFRANMRFTPTKILELAANFRFPADNLEKVLRLRELLIEFHKHTFLKGKLVLKGGTALNLFYLSLARLPTRSHPGGDQLSNARPCSPTTGTGRCDRWGCRAVPVLGSRTRGTVWRKDESHDRP